MATFLFFTPSRKLIASFTPPDNGGIDNFVIRKAGGGETQMKNLEATGFYGGGRKIQREIFSFKINENQN